ARPGTPFLIATAFGTLQTAVEAMRAGVYDIVVKPVDVGELALKLRKALHLRSLETENVRLKAAVDALRGRVEIVGSSRRIRDLLAAVEQVAPSRATVLIRGESGTGKELIAKAVHVASPRHDGPFVKVNCAAIPDNLLEDELFGHVKGAFTGAVADRRGKFESANKGTIFLDEIGEMPLHLQPKLLRVLQEREIEPLGADETRLVDVRVLAATNRDLKAMVAEGRFREDLYYRLNVVPIDLPPLRERPEDVPLLAQHFLEKSREANGRKVAGFTRAALEKLAAQPWPGNVRELENCVERAVVLSGGPEIDAADLRLGATERAGAASAAVDALFAGGLSLDQLEREILVEALRRSEGNLSKTARRLGLTRRALQYRVEKIRADDEEPPAGGDDDEDAP
ncbi:MAG TPA: sigma-54 dependent transcriptional regulator, partial [Planctomycetota bacterium]|nr:sigma-54 dependent transcriptional regulator [Planctomycetota bacterium]